MRALLSALLVPSGVAYSLFLLGVCCLPWYRTRRVSLWLLTASGLVTVIFSSGYMAAALMSPLEYAYPAVHDTRLAPHARQIVMLTGYAADDPDMPVTGRLNNSSAHRATMTLQLFGDCGACTVIVTGGPETARVTGDALVALGVPREQLVIESRSRTTAESASNLRPLVTGQFFLVTSGGHMTRSMAAMHRQGLDPIAVPTDYHGPRDWRRAEWRPSAQSLEVSDLAVHEYLGRFWYRLKGEIRAGEN